MQKSKGLTEYARKALRNSPNAVAEIYGSPAYPEIEGTVAFYETKAGVLVMADIRGLPMAKDDCDAGIFGMHIHEGLRCTGTKEDPFAGTRSHYNPKGCPHPQHAGDLPPLFCVNRRAWYAFVTNRFSLREILGRTVVIHRDPDDFVTQPAGNSGEKIACGVIL